MEVSKQKDRSIEVIRSEEQKKIEEKLMCISELWDKIKQLLAIHGIRVPEEERIE